MRTIFTSFSFLFLGLFALGQAPTGYYDSAEGKEGNDLKQALYDIIKNHNEQSYGDARYILDEADQDPDNSNNVRTIYAPISVNGTWDSGVTWNREHVWSKSRGITMASDDNDTYGAGSDLHNLRACVPEINSDKSNRWFAECTNKHYYNGSWTGSYYAGEDWDAAQFYWKPRDEDKGDVARIMFYMTVRYEGENGEPDLELLNYVPSSNSTTDPVYALFKDLYQWHQDDPVDDFERNRNNVIYSYQNNRNPFIDNPDWVEKTFTTLVNQKEVEKVDKIPTVYPNPSVDEVSIYGINTQLKYSYSIYDYKGAMVVESRPLQNDKVNITDLDNGMYCIILQHSSYINYNPVRLTFIKQ